MTKSTLFAVLTFSLFVFMISCSASRRASDDVSSSGSALYPAWYSASSEFSESADSFTSYGMAIAVDSTAAVRKAVAQATSNLEQHISSALESARKKAAPGHSELDTPSFIFTLRKAEAAISGAASVAQTASIRHETCGSYYGFAEVNVSKETVANELDPAFGENRRGWQTLKDSVGLAGSD